MYGTTLRVYDPGRDSWDITFIDPVRQTDDRMTGRQAGPDIIQEYRKADGTICQWCSFEITANSFHWVNRGSTDQRKTWRLACEYHLKRRAQA
jgi:hypothetical protein